MSSDPTSGRLARVHARRARDADPLARELRRDRIDRVTLHSAVFYAAHAGTLYARVGAINVGQIRPIGNPDGPVEWLCFLPMTPDRWQECPRMELARARLRERIMQWFALAGHVMSAAEQLRLHAQGGQPQRLQWKATA